MRQVNEQEVAVGRVSKRDLSAIQQFEALHLSAESGGLSLGLPGCMCVGGEGRGGRERVHVDECGELSTSWPGLTNLQAIGKPKGKKKCTHIQQVGLNTSRKQSNGFMDELIG